MMRLIIHRNSDVRVESFKNIIDKYNEAKDHIMVNNSTKSNIISPEGLE